MSLSVWDWLKSQRGMEQADLNIKSAVKQISYSQYWIKTHSEYQGAAEVSDRVKLALLNRFEKIRENVIPEADSIIERITVCVAKDSIDQGELRDLINRLSKLRPDQRRLQDNL